MARSRSRVIRYTVEMDFVILQGSGFHYATPTPWPGKYVGRVSDKALARVVAAFVESLRDGGANCHLTKAGIIGVCSARVRDAHNGNRVVATWTQE